MDVRMKDRKQLIEMIRIVLNMCEIGVDYPMAEMVYECVKAVEKKKGKFTILDACEMLQKHHDKWDKYIAQLNRPKIDIVLTPESEASND